MNTKPGPLSMTKAEYLALLDFPDAWLSLDMFPDELFGEQTRHGFPTHSDGAEHHRNGAFHWWLRRDPDKETLARLITLSFVDPDPLMASDVRGYIRKCTAFDADLQEQELALLRRAD